MSGRDLVQVFEVGESFWCALVLPDDWSCRRVSGPYSTHEQAAEDARYLSGKSVAKLEAMHRQLRTWLESQAAGAWQGIGSEYE